MGNTVINEVKKVIASCVNVGVRPEDLPDDFRLAGNVLDSMAVTNLILALEDHFGLMFEDEELTPEDFDTVQSLSRLVEHRMGSLDA